MIIKQIKKAYKSQKESAAKRGIEWQFTVEEWTAWWGDDFALRGRGRGRLVMARHGDIGPYHPDNVFKCLFEENARMVDRSKSNHKRSMTLTGRVVSDETRQKQREAQLGKTLSLATREKISSSCLGRTAPNKGKKMGEAFSQQLRDAWTHRKLIKEAEQCRI